MKFLTKLLFLALHVCTFSACTFNSTSPDSSTESRISTPPPPAPREDSPNDFFGIRTPQSTSLAPFESSSLLVPNKHAHENEADYSKQYWRARAGMEMWLKATYGNASDLKNLDWFQVLRTDQRGKPRFEKWGLISDPDCCTPGKNCEAKYPGKEIPNMHGYDYCPGDESAEQSSDQACDFRDQDGRTRAERGIADNTLSSTSCDLQFGTSAGVIGIRKFAATKSEAPGINRPYSFGIACAACHAGLHPLRPIHSLDRMNWSHISLSVGNPYLRLPKILATGMSPASWLAHHLSETPPGRAPVTLENASINHLNKVSLIANLDSRPQFETDGLVGPRFFVNGLEVVGLDHYLLKKVRGLVSFATRKTIPEFDIRLPALHEFISSLRTYQLPPELLPPAAARARGSQIFARSCATCHSSMRPVEVMDRRDRSIRMQETPLESSDSDFYSGANFLAKRADDSSLRVDYLSNEMDVSAAGTFDACSTQSREVNNVHVMKNISLLNPWLHLPLLSRGSVGSLPRVICESNDEKACLKNKTFELRRAMQELLLPSGQRRGNPLYLAKSWHLHLPKSNVNWILPSGTSWPLIDQFQVDDFDQDLADSRRTTHAAVVRSAKDSAANVIQSIEKFLRIYRPMSAASSVVNSIPESITLSPQMTWSLRLARAQTEAVLRAYSSCERAQRVHRFTDSSGHDFGVDLSAADKKDLIDFLIGL